MKKLLLFDVDRTLVLAPAAEHFTKLVRDTCGLAAVEDWDTSGLTDQMILTRLLSAGGWEEKRILASMPTLIEELGRTYAESFDGSAVRPIPGVTELLRALVEHGAVLGLITGNLRSIAELKLDAVGIYSRFVVGAFGDDEHSTRADLVRTAVRRARFEDRLGDTYVFGDTVLDIKASLDAGVNNAVGVSNGFRSTGELLRGGATIVLENFLDATEVLHKLGFDA